MSDAFYGEIRMFAGSFNPVHWAQCDGALLPVAGNEALYSLLSNTYGGSPLKDFGLPDLRGRLPVGRGEGTGLAPRYIGSRFGAETITLTADQNPFHTHRVQASTNKATANTPSGDMVLAAAVSPDLIYASTTDPSKLCALDDVAVAGAGGSDGVTQPHSNLMPALCLNFIICLLGTYPTRPKE